MEWEPGTFGRLYATDYDAANDPGTTRESVALISELAGPDARMLELAIGTGRMALPLAARGHRIEGIEASPEMVEGLRAKPGGRDIPVTIGDMAEVGREGPFDFAFLVFNTIFNLTSQDAQVRLFANMAARLAPGGRFLVETFVPDFSAYTDNQRMKALDVRTDRLRYEAVHHDPVGQVLTMQRVVITPTGTELRPLVMRYAWPAEMDLMARLAGLRLADRWGSWTRTPFGPDSRMHVSLYERPA